MNETDDYYDTRRITHLTTLERHAHVTGHASSTSCLERPTEAFPDGSQHRTIPLSSFHRCCSEPCFSSSTPTSSSSGFLRRQRRVSRQWLRARGCLLLLAPLLPFPLSSRESPDVRQLGSLAPPAAMTTMTTIITGFFVLSSGFGLSSGWHVHPPTWRVKSVD